MSETAGVVYLVGAGPGDPRLITRRGHELIKRADAIVYDGLIGRALLDDAPAGCELIYAGKKHAPDGTPMTQHQINDRLVELGRAGKRVVRLKGGDPFVFGRGAGECEALAAAAVRFEIVPGVSALTAVPAYAGIPLTDRLLSSTVAVATGHEAAGKPHTDVDWRSLAHAKTVVLFMALRTAAECTHALIEAGKDPTTPAAAIYWGTTASQRTVTSTLAELPTEIARAGLVPPVLLVVGDVVRRREELAWFENRPLSGVRVLCTRRAEQAGAFADAVAALGGEPVLCPVTRIEPVTGDDRNTLDAGLSRLSQFGWLLFTSANAVERFFAELGSLGLDARVLGSAKVAAVGRVTAAALASHSIGADLVPPRGDATGLAKALLEQLGDDKPTIAVCRAARGRDDAIDALTEAGCQVELLPLYRTVIAAPVSAVVSRHLDALENGAIDVVALFAPSQVRALFDMLGHSTAEILGKTRAVAAIGRTTAAALATRGVTAQVIPSRPSAVAMAQAIAEHLAQTPPEP